MTDPRLLCAKFCFSVLAILFIVVFSSFSIYKFILNKDWSYGTYRNFHDDTSSRYPSLSVCLSDNENIKLFKEGYSSADERKSEGQDVNNTMISYQNFLTGQCKNKDRCRWNKSLSEIDYDKVTLPIEDYILGAALFFKNGSKHWVDTQNYSNISTSTTNLIKVYTSKREAHEKCFTFEIPYILNSRIHLVSVLYNLSMFGKDGVRPESGGFNIRLHYPNQMLSVNIEKSRWAKAPLATECISSSENDKCDRSYTLNFRIQTLEAISRRNTRRHKCNTDWENYDNQVQLMFANRIECAPNHWNILSKLEKCKHRKQLQQVNKFNEYTNMQNINVPCEGLKSITYSHEDTPGLTAFSSLNYKHPTGNKSLNFQDVIKKGNVSELLLEFQVGNIWLYFIFILIQRKTNRKKHAVSSNFIHSYTYSNLHNMFGLHYLM